MKFSKLAVIAIAALAMPFSTYAQTVLSEPFSYPDGPLVGAPGSPWTTNSGTAGQQNVVGGRLFIDDNETEDTIASLSTAATNGIPFITATFSLQMDPLDIVTSATGDYITHFTGSNNAFIGRVFMLTDPAGTGSTFRIGLSTNAAAPNVVFANVFTLGTTYNLSLSYDLTSNLASLSVAGVGQITATDAVDNNNINRYSFRQTTNTGDVFFDNLVVSIPEPTTYMLLGLGALVCAQAYRRRKAA